MSETFLVCGNFGHENTGAGQSVKTRVFAETLQKTFPDVRVICADTTPWLKRPVRVFCELRKGFMAADKIFALPGQRGILIIAPLLSWWQRRFGKDVRYIVVGGWLPGALRESRLLRSCCSKFNGIYVEAKAMKEDLEAIGLSNVRHFPNFKTFSFRTEVRPVGVPLRVLFLSRIERTKGVELAIEAVKRQNERLARDICHLDICGRVDPGYAREFEDQRSGFPASIRYRGFIDQDRVFETVATYDLLIFPTFYHGEGFAGVILDAYISGVPVLASDWQYNAEIVLDGKTGLLCKPNDLGDLSEKLGRLIDDPALLLEMKSNCLNEAPKFHADEVMKILIDDLQDGR